MSVTILDVLGISVLRDIYDKVVSIEKKVSALMASFEEAKQAWVDYATELKEQRDDAVAALSEAQTKAQQAADALAQFQADDAATDAQQLADQAQAFADELSSALESVQTPPSEPEPLPDPGTPDDGSGLSANVGQ